MEAPPPVAPALATGCRFPGRAGPGARLPPGLLRRAPGRRVPRRARRPLPGSDFDSTSPKNRESAASRQAFLAGRQEQFPRSLRLLPRLHLPDSCAPAAGGRAIRLQAAPWSQCGTAPCARPDDPGCATTVRRARGEPGPGGSRPWSAGRADFGLPARPPADPAPAGANRPESARNRPRHGLPLLDRLIAINTK